jgi:dTDP-4-dehydrorhamnose 3,5-epimerase-like enzyme
MFGSAKDIVRGQHAHHTLRSFAVCITGSCKISFNDGKSSKSIVLDNHLKCVSLEPMIWHDLSDFSSDCVVLVLADAHYDESDYIRDYDEFLRLIQP